LRKVQTKLKLDGARVIIGSAEARECMMAIFSALGEKPHIAGQVADHLVETSLSGIESHGLMRVLQYAEQFRSGYLRAGVEPVYHQTESGTHEVDGNGGLGIPAMQLAFDESARLAEQNGIVAMAIRNCGHTGRHGAFADKAASSGLLTILTGGGNRKTWRQVAPYGGAKGMLPTNPWCVGIPGGRRGPVVLDFATSKIAGGWIYAARSAGARLPEGCIIDKNGNPTDDPEDYFNGGAILPSGEHKGYALALMGELIGEALLGPATTECNWLLITIDTTRYRQKGAITDIAEEILAEMRTCPPAPGFDRVEVPGEREREQMDTAGGLIAVPEITWNDIVRLASSLDCSPKTYQQIT